MGWVGGVVVVLNLDLSMRMFFCMGKKCKDCVSIQFGELSEVQALSWEEM